MKKYLLTLLILLFVLKISAQEKFILHPNVYSKKYIIGTPIKLGSIEIAEHVVVTTSIHDATFVIPFLNYHDALAEVKKLGPGWRLPTKDELLMINGINTLPNGKTLFYPNFGYWCSGIDSDGWATFFYFSNNIITKKPYSEAISPFYPMGIVITVRDIKK